MRPPRSRAVRVALVVMPFQPVETPNLGASILKSRLRRAGVECRVLYFNVEFARIVGLERYARLLGLKIAPEILFSHALFGKAGTREIRYPRPLGAVLTKAGMFGEEIRAGLRGDMAAVERLAERQAPRFREACLSAASWGDYDVVGFSSIFNSHVASLGLARDIKERHPDTKIVFGGSNVEGIMGRETLRAFPWVDFVVGGEAEDTFPALLSALKAGRSPDAIPGVSYRDARGLHGNHSLPPPVDLGESVPPDFSDYFGALERGGLRKSLRPVVVFESARGCWWGERGPCAFCGLNGLSMTFRRKPPRKILREIFDAMRRYRVSDFHAADRVWDPAHATTFLPLLSRELKKRRLDVGMLYEVRPTITKKHLDLLARAGVTDVQPGLETLDTAILKRMNKGTTALRNVQTLKHCREADIFPRWNFLYGLPGEKASAYRRMARLLPKIQHLPPPTMVTPVRIERFSPLHRHPGRFGLKNLRPAALYGWAYPQSRVRLKDLAYYFEGQFRKDCVPPWAAIASFRRRLERWNALSRHSFLFHRHAWDSLIVYDHRPRSLSQGVRPFRIRRYEGTSSAEIYEACAAGRTTREVERTLKRRRPKGRFPQVEIRRALRRFVRDGIMLEEGGRFLALSLPFAACPPAVKRKVMLLEKMRGIFHEGRRAE
ncbi:MAG TPA: RiPP maturation radical SAM C-methyltransferase [Elusimicrobiota bacterium]|nr:RiPP maturation radical SAM C-methyltransferase [Elusimicrobiota bacterium]